MTTKPHLGYVGSIDVDLDAGQLYGKLLHVQDLVTFTGSTPAELQTAFQEAVEDYLATCEQVGKSPDKPFSGTFQVRLPSEVHRKLACDAALAGKSLNDWVAYLLSAESSALAVPQNVNVSFVPHVNVGHVIDATAAQFLTADTVATSAHHPSHVSTSHH